MAETRRRVLGGLFVGSGVLAALALADIVATVFFAITVAILLVPVCDALVDRGLSAWWASLLATLAAFVGIVVALSPLAFVVVTRLDAVVALLRTAPESVAFEAFEMTYTVTFAQALSAARTVLSDLARTAVVVAPVFALKLTVFAMVVFALLLNQDAARRALMGVVPGSYRDIAAAFGTRIRSTLFAVYVMQAATAVGTFLIALPVFFGLGYDIPFTLAVVAAVLQFVPVVGPSVLVVAIAAYHVVVGQSAAAVAVLLVGGVLIGWLPDVLVRPRLARRTTGMSGTLYFVGFIGGILTLGVVGVVAGPLAIAIFAEAAELLTAHLDEDAAAEG